MKIIATDTDNIQRKREILLDREIERLGNEYKLQAFLYESQSLDTPMSFQSWDAIHGEQWKKSLVIGSLHHEAKSSYIDSIRLMIDSLVKRRERLQCPKPLQMFSRFASLPRELRLMIWEHTFEAHMRARVHCIDVSSPHYKNMTRDIPYETASNSQEVLAAGLETGKLTLVSNHPIHPALHICRESRRYYLAQTCTTFAFETYINFSSDTIYIPDRIARWNNFYNAVFPHFLRCDSAKRLHKFALQKEFLREYPVEGEIFAVEKLPLLRKLLPKLNELIVFFNDDRPWSITWRDLETAFIDLSSRQKRLEAESYYARCQTRRMGKIEEGLDITALTYRHVALERRLEIMSLEDFHI